MKKAFTLAEVLITLAIIGIVAALTIPSVISNYQQQEFKTGLKKAVSVLNEAIQTNIAQEGETPYENNNLYEYLPRHMSVIKKEWGVGQTCYDTNGNVIYDENHNSCSGDDVKGSESNFAFYTSDGMRFEIPMWTSSYKSRSIKLHESGLDLPAYREQAYNTYYNQHVVEGCGMTWHNCYCGSYGLANNTKSTIFPPCIVTVDVNGNKAPNPPSGAKYEYWGNGNIKGAITKGYSYPSPTDKKLQDIFNILITEDKAIPFGVVAQRAMYSK